MDWLDKVVPLLLKQRTISMALPVCGVRAPTSLCLSSLLALTLGACGGSDGGSSFAPSRGGIAPPDTNTPARVIINANTADELSASVLQSSQALTDTEMLAALGMTAEAQAAASTPRSVGAPPLPATNRIALSQIAEQVLKLTLTHSPESAFAAPARASDTALFSCVGGGSWTYQRVDADNDGQLSAGDISTLSFENCAGELEGTVNGTLRQELVQLTGEFDLATLPTQAFVWQANYTFTNFSLQRTGLKKQAHGSFGVNFNYVPSTSTLTANLSAPLLTLTEGQRSYTYTGFETTVVINEAQATQALAISGTVTDSVLGTYTVQTLQAIVAPLFDDANVNFIQGKLIVTGEKSTMTGNFLDNGSVRWEIDSNADGRIDGTYVE